MLAAAMTGPYEGMNLSVLLDPRCLLRCLTCGMLCLALLCPALASAAASRTAAELVGTALPARDPARALERTLDAVLVPAADAAQDFAVTALRDAFGLHRYRVRQRWNALPVLGHEALVVTDARGVVVSALGRMGAIMPPASRTVAMSPAQAAQAALSTEAPMRAAECVMVEEAGDTRIAWALETGGQGAEATRVLVDAATGRVLRRESLSAHAVGSVYDADPRSGLRDVALPRLGGDGSRLSAPGLVVLPATGDPVVRGDGDFRFVPASPDTTPFDQVNVYHHADAFLHDFVGGLGLGSTPDSIVVHVQADLYPAIALTTQNYVSFGRAIPGLSGDPAKGQDVVCHELQHVITYSFGIQPTGTDREAGALHEAISDYMAAAWTQDPAIGEWVYIPYPNGVTRVDRPSSPFCYANYNRVAYGGVEAGSAWANGMILSGALWQLRGRVGASADSLALQALAYLPREPLWSDFADALLLADRAFHGGRLRADVLAVFQERGILGSSLATLAGPDTLSRGQAGTWHVASVSAAGPARWWVQHYVDCQPVGDPVAQATGDSLVYSDAHDFEIQVVVPGAWTDSVTATRFVSVERPTLDVQGPPVTARGGLATYRAHTTGAGSIAVTWWRTRMDGHSAPDFMGYGDALTFQPDTALRLEARATDALGRDTRRTLDVQWLSLLVEWPLSVVPGVPTHLRAFPRGVSLPYTVRWEERVWHDGVADTSWSVLGTGKDLVFVPAHDADVRCSADAGAGSFAVTQTFLSVEGASIVIRGPLVHPGAFEYFAAWRGLPTQTVSWYLLPSTLGATERLLGTGVRMTVTDTPPYRLRVQSVDRLARKAGMGIEVAADGTATTPRWGPPLRMDVITENGAPPQLLCSIPGASHVRIALYDVAGREVALLADAEQSAGSRAYALPPALPQGVYLARMRVPGTDIVKRIVWVR
jgi:hypothetical protein